MIICCGEALIDFMPINSTGGKAIFQPRCGGSPVNVAIALGRLQTRVGWFGGLSTDMFGQMLARELADSNVDASLAVRSAYPTTLAFVDFSSDQPEYAFLDENSANRMVAEVPVLGDEVTALHFGSFSLINDPAASIHEQLARAEKPGRIITLDPNIRPTLVHDEKAYRARLDRMIALADIIKVSDEDLAWMEAENIAQQWLAQGAGLVVITRGSSGATAYGADFSHDQPAEQCTIADTVGAGDAFMAGLLSSLDTHGLLSRNTFADIDQDAAAKAMNFASHVAALTVSRKGANPPWKDEL